MALPKLVFSPPQEVRILSVAQIMFTHPQTQNTSVCKVDLSRLNKKLQKLQREGMFVIGVFFTDLDQPSAVQPHSQGGVPNV